jgi:ADP-heptose:LPS heptosyltransferase
VRRSERIDRMASDCVHFKSNRPCKPHEIHGQTCRCLAYCPRSSRRLIIQLSSAAEVIRSLALVARIKEDDPESRIAYLTSFPELLPGVVDEPLGFDAGNVLRCQQDHFDDLYNLDLDKRACAITNVIPAERKKGFHLQRGQCVPIDEDSQAYYLKRVLPQACEPEYHNPVQDLFCVCGLEYRSERSWLKLSVNKPEHDRESNYLVVGLHTIRDWYGVAKAYWNPDRWELLIEMLRQHQMQPILLGDRDADFMNRQIARRCDIEYAGVCSLKRLLTRIYNCDVVVGASGVAVEMALALGREVVLLQDKRSLKLDRRYLRGKGSIVDARADSGEKEILADLMPEQVLQAIQERQQHVLSESRLSSAKSSGHNRMIHSTVKNA